MARTEITTTYCDASHAADFEAVARRELTIDGASYEIDLCAGHDAEYSRALERLLLHARPIAAVPRRHVKRSVASRRQAATVRSWWRSHPDQAGVPYTERGRIPVTVSAAWSKRSS